MNKEVLCDEIFSELTGKLPNYWNGEDAIMYMKNNNCRNWRQMEWPGWYFQFMCENILSNNNYFKIPGPAYGKVRFDGFKYIPWDFKAHTLNSSSGDKVPTNGYLEVQSAICEYGSVGFIIASGTAMFDDDNQTFKKWHDKLKGKISEYERSRVARGATSRRRKVSFKLESVDFIFLDETTLNYCDLFQKGMRNSNGTPRNPKVMIDISDKRLERYILKK